MSLSPVVLLLRHGHPATLIQVRGSRNLRVRPGVSQRLCENYAASRRGFGS